VRDPEMLIHGLANDVFLDDKRFWPIFERAQALDVSLYLLHYETLAFSQEPDHARTSFQERERYATALIGIARRSPGGQAPGG
jgi:predicted TIM-barrel fold metal-dependent hydrolase